MLNYNNLYIIHVFYFIYGLHRSETLSIALIHEKFATDLLYLLCGYNDAFANTVAQY